MRTETDLERPRVSPSPAARPASAWRWCSRFTARGAHVAFVARTASAVERTARATGAHGIVGDVGRKEDIYPIALQITGMLGGLDVLDQQRLEPRPGAALAPRRHRMRGAGAGARRQPLGPFRLTKALLRRARRIGARAARRRSWSTSRATPRSTPMPAGAPTARARRRCATDRDLGRGSGRRRRALPLASIPATWTRRCTRSPCPTPIRRR